MQPFSLLLLAFIVLSAYATDPETLSELCNKSDESRKICDELISRIVTAERQAEDNSQVVKRKASFIRFGKRSAPMYDDDDLSFVDKRKASFIRFGRK